VYSVWDGLPAEIMGWFFLSTVLLIYARTQIAQHETLWHRLASFVHLASWTSLVIILSPFGFGFDQVVHQASELFLRTHGWIGLPSPLYAGQYWLVAGISWIMRVDVRMVDTLLAPIAFLFAMRALAYATRVKAPWMTMAIALPLSLFAYGTFTVPWHTGIACAVGAMAGCWYGTRNAKKTGMGVHGPCDTDPSSCGDSGDRIHDRPFEKNRSNAPSLASGFLLGCHMVFLVFPSVGIASSGNVRWRFSERLA
jgi:hypothetical protein